MVVENNREMARIVLAVLVKLLIVVADSEKQVQAGIGNH